MREAATHQARAGAADSGKRLDRFLADSVPGLSRMRLKALIENGHVAADGQTITDPSYRVKPGSGFRVRVPPTVAPEPVAQALPLAIRFEDEHLIVLDKPAGLVVHPAPGNPDLTLVNALIAHCGDRLSGIGGVRRPGIVHRLDKDTSGLLVVAKSDPAHAGLAQQFAKHAVERAYRAAVWGLPAPARGEFDGAIGRHPRDRKKMAVVARGGKPALTRYRMLRAFGTAASLLDCRLETGRTHQIRVHLAAAGHPVIGDPLYGRARGGRAAALPPSARRALAAFPRQALHAYLLGFRHPVTGRSLRFESENPADLRGLLAELEAL